MFLVKLSVIFLRLRLTNISYQIDLQVIKTYKNDEMHPSGI